MKEQVTLVDEQDNASGACEKLEAHLKGLLHRAFSVFIFNDKGELLLQKRAAGKYHSGNLWTNTCCGHPRPGEDTRGAAIRRLKEEMGISCELKEVFHFTYRAELDKNITEHEYDHVFFGEYSGDPMPDPLEASGWRFADLHTLRKELETQPQQFTAWFRICFDKVAEFRLRK